MSRIMRTDLPGYVRYESAQVADTVRDKLNGKLFTGRKVSIESFKPCELRKPDAGLTSQTPERRPHLLTTGQMCPPTDTVPATDTESVPAVDTPSCTESVPVVQQNTKYVPMYGSPGKRLTIYMLESADLDVQVSMAFDYLFPLVEKIHPDNAKEMTRKILLTANNFEIMDMYTCPETLRAKVEKMEAIQKAREAGYTPEQIKVMFNLKQKKKRKKNKKKQN